MDTELIEKAKSLIDNFVMTEYEQSTGADFSDLSKIEIAYTETEDEQHSIQAYIDLLHPCIFTTIDGKTVNKNEYKSLEKLIEDIPYLDFEDLIYVDEEMLTPFYG